MTFFKDLCSGCKKALRSLLKPAASIMLTLSTALSIQLIKSVITKAKRNQVELLLAANVAIKNNSKLDEINADWNKLIAKSEFYMIALFMLIPSLISMRYVFYNLELKVNNCCDKLKKIVLIDLLVLAGVASVVHSALFEIGINIFSFEDEQQALLNSLRLSTGCFHLANLNFTFFVYQQDRAEQRSINAQRRARQRQDRSPNNVNRHLSRAQVQEEEEQKLELPELSRVVVLEQEADPSASSSTSSFHPD